MPSLKELVTRLDDVLQTRFYKDASLNGLQVEACEEVKHVAVAVDGRLSTFQKAVELGADLLIVHHGLFWGRSEALVGPHLKRIRTLLDGKLSLYASHLPLDGHEEYGNNVELARALGLEEIEAWSEYKGQVIGRKGRFPEPFSIDELQERLTSVLKDVDGTVMRYGQGRSQVQTVGIVTGDASQDFLTAARDGLDVFITGEPNHIFAAPADEWDTWMLCGGHYATETFGVRAVGRWLEEEFGVKVSFVHAPTFS
jgi:dinuclear metal center YbgI/SA1388 family protein